MCVPKVKKLSPAHAISKLDHASASLIQIICTYLHKEQMTEWEVNTTGNSSSSPVGNNSPFPMKFVVLSIIVPGMLCDLKHELCWPGCSAMLEIDYATNRASTHLL